MGFLVGCDNRPPIASAPEGQVETGSDQKNCIWEFVGYEPSAWEEEWRKGEESGERQDRECEVLAQTQEASRSRQLVDAVQSLSLRGKPIPAESIALFSRMIYARRCGPKLKDTGERRVQLIEPLIGLLRDPLTICPQPSSPTNRIERPFGLGENAIQSKRHFLISPAAPWTETPEDANSWQVGGFEPWAMDPTPHAEPPCRQNILIDMGASLYGAWNGDPSAVGALWFVDRFRKYSIAFDRIVSYEIEKHDPDEIYKNVPADILPHYMYFNQGIESSPGGKWNPWRILMGMGVTTRDYVVIKLDIDMPTIENSLIDQLENNPKLRLLIDEGFYEHHVNVKAMWPYWKTERASMTLKDSYRLLRNLRFHGVRMHSWP